MTTPKPPLTTASGIAVADNQNSLSAGPRGPLLLQDFHLKSPRDEKEAETLQQVLRKFRDSLALHLESVKPTV